MKIARNASPKGKTVKLGGFEARGMHVFLGFCVLFLLASGLVVYLLNVNNLSHIALADYVSSYNIDYYIPTKYQAINTGQCHAQGSGPRDNWWWYIKDFAPNDSNPGDGSYCAAWEFCGNYTQSYWGMRLACYSAIFQDSTHPVCVDSTHYRVKFPNSGGYINTYSCPSGQVCDASANRTTRGWNAPPCTAIGGGVGGGGGGGSATTVRYSSCAGYPLGGSQCVYSSSNQSCSSATNGQFNYQLYTAHAGDGSSCGHAPSSVPSGKTVMCCGPRYLGACAGLSTSQSACLYSTNTVCPVGMHTQYYNSPSHHAGGACNGGGSGVYNCCVK